MFKCHPKFETSRTPTDYTSMTIKQQTRTILINDRLLDIEHHSAGHSCRLSTSNIIKLYTNFKPFIKIYYGTI